MFFNYHNNQLYAEQVSVTEIAERFGTPCYIYSRKALEEQWQAFDQAFKTHPHRICYAVKANSNLAVLNVLARLESSFDIVSAGELARVLAAGGKAANIIFSGVGKQANEIEMALAAGIFCFNIESAAELTRLNNIAKKNNTQAAIALRINPDIDSGSHPYISTGLKENKFGIAIDEALNLFKQANTLSHIKIIGIACHIGSQLLELAPFLAALDRLLELIQLLRQQNINIQHLDIGGGLGVRYREEQPPSPVEYGAAILQKVRDTNLELILEPGRAIAAHAGILVTRVEYLKHTAHKNFAIVDAAMNDLLRPALYQAWQNIVPVQQHDELVETIYDVVGPVCETGDFLGKDRQLKIQQGDLLAVCAAGAYGFVMSSNYNSRPRVAEVMVDGDKSFLVRQREEIKDLFANEKILLY
jgi:diaminopimelate decarboxylase